MQLEIGLILSQILAFLIMLWVLKRFAWKPLLRILEERKQKIAAEFSHIELEKQKITELKKNYQEQLDRIDELTHQELMEAKEKSEKFSHKMQQETLLAMQHLREKAHSEIQLEIENAKKELKNSLVDGVIRTSKKIIGTQLDAEQDKELILEYLEKI